MLSNTSTVGQQKDYQQIRSFYIADALFNLAPPLRKQPDAVTALVLVEETEPVAINSLYQFKNIELLTILNCQLIGSKIDFEQLPKLKYLELNELNFESCPSKLELLDSLLVLDLYDNKIHSFPKTIFQHQSIEKLLLNHQDVDTVSLPTTLNSNLKLMELSLGQNPLYQLPSSFFNFPHLRSLNLNQCKLTTLPNSLSQSKKLTRLSLSNNPLDSIPAVVYQLESLEALDLSHTKIKELNVEQLQKLRNLKSINLSHTNLKSIPDALFKLPNLTTINISQITGLNFTLEERIRQTELMRKSNKHIHTKIIW